MRMRHAPAKIVRTQNTHRQDTPATFIYPATKGPNAGPANGARAKNAHALPLVSTSHTSAISALKEEKNYFIDHDYISLDC